MQILIDENKRAIGSAPDGMEWYYPDERWQIVHVPDDAEVAQGIHDFVDYEWDGEAFKLKPQE